MMRKNNFSTQNIKFTDTIGVPEEYYPVPASRLIPDWYKELDSYVGGEKKPDGTGKRRITGKRCMPMFDAMSSGYIISTYTDLWISRVPDQDGILQTQYEWAHFNPIEFHPKIQLPEHPYATEHKGPYPKWVNAWSIITPPGYSTLFISPLHRETPFITFPGVVDTDTFYAPVSFPFVFKDAKFEGLIPAGTPIIQVIPFKREKWKNQVGGQEEYKQQLAARTKVLSLFFDSYKKQFRKPKEYT